MVADFTFIERSMRQLSHPQTAVGHMIEDNYKMKWDLGRSKPEKRKLLDLTTGQALIP